VVLANVLSNAIKYTPDGGRIGVTATRVEAGEMTTAVRVAVTDTGRGVPAELSERVFEKFFRVEHQTPGNGGVRGSGIGLYLAREVVDAHGGWIRCEPGEDDRGTRIVFELPVTGPPGTFATSGPVEALFRAERPMPDGEA
jgi:signal transduction histidine kinase